MPTYHEKLTETTREDAQGNIVVDTTREVKAIKKNDEPDYIKLYTRMWCEFNGIPSKYHQLFLSLACRMTYANLGIATGGQIVHTIGHSAQEIMTECGWKNRDSLYKGLQSLCDCKAIIKLGRGEYQINPQYAGKGPWHYKKDLQQGGIADLVAKFNFADRTVDTKITWASTSHEEIGDADEVIATKRTITPITPTSADNVSDVPTVKQRKRKELTTCAQ